MKNNRLFNRAATIALIAGDAVAFLVAFGLTLAIYNAFGGEKDTFENFTYSHYFFVFVFPIILYAFLRRGHYTRREPWWSEVRFIFFSLITAFFIDVSARILYQVPLLDIIICGVWILAFAFVLIGRQLVCFGLKKCGIWDIDTILIGKADTVIDLLYAFHADYYTGYKVQKIILRDRKDADFDISLIPAPYRDVEIINDPQAYKAAIEDSSDHYYVIDFDTFRGDARDALIQDLGRKNILYSVVPPINSMRLFEMRPQNFFGYDIMLLQSRNVSDNLVGKFTKRLIDLVVATIAIITLSPVFLIVAICQKKEGQGGSLFYGGERIGKDGVKFKCWKFRSMEPDSDHLFQALLESDDQIKSDWDKFQKLKVDDPRVQTKTSRLMRKTSIDELPQLWNVIKGDMSLVGPRPILESEIPLFGSSFDNYIQVRPGVTGLWQVSGRNDTSFERRVYMDNWYVRNRSIWGDITILFKTIMVVLKGSGM